MGGVTIINRTVKNDLPEVTRVERPEEGEGSHVTVMGEECSKKRGQPMQVLRPGHAFEFKEL